MGKSTKYAIEYVRGPSKEEKTEEARARRLAELARELGSEALADSGKSVAGKK
jgi:hypothetical protein